MTKGLDSVFGLPSMEDILNDIDDDEVELDDELVEVEPTELAPATTTSVASFTNNELISVAELRAQEHAEAMDAIHTKVLKHADDAAELAFDLDPARAPRMLEVAAIYYKTAIDAKNSKRDAQLKLMKLIQDQRKLDIDERKLAHETGEIDSTKASVIMVEDRNALLKRMREDAKAEAATKAEDR